MKYFILFLILGLFCSKTDAFAQKFMLLDKYGYQRKKLNIGDNVIFRLQETPTRYTGYIYDLTDSAAFISGFQEPIALDKFHTFYFRRKSMDFLRKGLVIFVIGFAFNAAVLPTSAGTFNDWKEQAAISLSFLTISQATRLFTWRKYKMKFKRSRVRVLDLNPIETTITQQ